MITFSVDIQYWKHENSSKFECTGRLSLIKEDLNIENKVWEKLDVYSTYETASGNSEITDQRLYL